MYYPVGWPKLLDSHAAPLKLSVDKVKILFAILYEKSICIWFCKPSVPITYHRRTEKCISENGTNAFVEWKVDSSKLVVAVSFLIFFSHIFKTFFLLTWMFFPLHTLFHSFRCVYVLDALYPIHLI